MSKDAIVINAKQLKEALKFINADEDPTQLETEICIQYRNRWIDEDGEAHEAGLYVWLIEYPEEGVDGPL